MSLQEKNQYTVKALGQIQKWWDGQAFKAEIIAKAQPLTKSQAESLLLGRKPSEMEVAVYTKPTLLPTPSQATNALQLAHSSKLQELGRAVIDAVVKAGTETLRLCEYIRNNQVAPKLVSSELQALGLSKSWASKVNSVANAGDDVWNAFAARTLTFKGVLSLEAGDSQAVKSLAAEMGADVVDIKAQIQEQSDKEESEPVFIEPTPKEKAEKRKLSNQRAFATLVKNFKEESKKDWGSDQSTSLSIEQINCGAILRIADATEKLAFKYTQMEKDLAWYKEQYSNKTREIARLNRVAAALRGHMKRTKNQQ